MLYTNPEDYIPYTLRTEVNQIDPRLDVFWQDQLLDLFKKISAQDRKNIAKQILIPKKIFWNSTHKRFEYRPDEIPSLEQAIEQIPANGRRLKAFASKLNHYLNMLKTYDNVIKISELLENLIGQIQKLDVEDSVALQRAKQRILTEFIYEVAEIIRSKKELVVPPNARGLNTPILKTLINEVYLKNQLLGFYFKTLRNRQLAEMPDKLINTFLRKEQKIRQLEVVKASKYLFAIAPTIEYSVNPFTIRRFLLEERLFSGTGLLFNGVAVNTALLANANPQYIQNFQKQISCIISIETTISRQVIDFYNQVEQYHDEVLMPLLFKPFLSSQDIHSVVTQRVQQYEVQLTQYILEPLKYALTQLVGNSDESEYLYVGMRQLFGTIIQVFKDFQMQPAVLGHENANMLLSKLIAYATFLEKRRYDVYVYQSEIDWEKQHAEAQIALDKVRELVNSTIQHYSEQIEQVEAQQQLYDEPETLVDKLLKRKHKQQETILELKKKARKMAWEVHQKIFYLPRDFKEKIVHLEFDSTLTITDETQRNYAFPAGYNGITRLPILITLPESRLDFDLIKFSKKLDIWLEEQ